ncbi:MAG: FliH/SctL family protein [Gemmatimonadota bacterium]|nr:FliH/SctL family protein [Gemmatimonadota bacterium]
MTHVAWDLTDLAAKPQRGPSQEELDAIREDRHAKELEATYRRGRAEGEEAARVAARRDLTHVFDALSETLQLVTAHRETWEKNLMDNLVALSTAIARHIVGRELRGDVDTYRELVRKSIASFPLDHRLRIRLHPTDLGLLGGNLEDGVMPPEDTTGGRDARWIPDPEVVPGGVVVEGPDSIVDGRVDAALERLYRVLTDA